MPNKKINDLINRRTKLIQNLLDKLESRVIASQKDLLKVVLEDFVDGLETDESGNIKNTIGNKRRFAMFDKVFARYANRSGLEVVKGITDGVNKIVNFNKQYFSVFESPATLIPINSQIKQTLSSWLGITERGKVEPNGYLNTLVKSEQVRNQIKTFVLKSVVSQRGFIDLKKNLQSFIEGNKEKTGLLERYYRSFAYDTYSVVDRTAAKITADKLKFDFAIYEGGLIKDSRIFCKKHNGKVYSRKEISEFKPNEAIGADYDPFISLGGYNCRHHLSWIPTSVAIALRPDLK